MNSKYDKSSCSRCSKMHLCTGTAQCPCFDLPVSEEVLEYVASHFDSCVCLGCLEELQKEIVK